MSTKAIPEGDHFKLTSEDLDHFREHDLAKNIIHLVLRDFPIHHRASRVSAFSWFQSFSKTANAHSLLWGPRTQDGYSLLPLASSIWRCPWLACRRTPQGMRGMFTMMNHARLNVGLEGVSLFEIAYQTALSTPKTVVKAAHWTPANKTRNTRPITFWYTQMFAGCPQH